MKRPIYNPQPKKKKSPAELGEVFAYLKGTPAIGMVILLLTLVSLLVLPYDTLLPVFAKVIFKGDAETFGYINSFIGLGALGSTFFLASLKPGADLKRTLLFNTIIFALNLILFSHIGYFSPAILFAALGGFGM